jgi:hypothetical protein
MKKLRLKKWVKELIKESIRKGVKELLKLMDLFLMSLMILILLYRCTALGGIYEYIGFSSVSILIGLLVYAIKKDNEI